jgi:glutamate formiminotransferase/formiminotetrahydrofolate cyclodeaminase
VTTDGADRSIADYAAAVASGSPTPGGGSVAATVAALAAALGEMVCNVTLTGKSRPERSEVLEEASMRGQHLRQRLLELAIDDESAYSGYQAALAMPRATDHQKQERRIALDAALVGAAEIPLAIASSCVDILRLLLIVAHDGTKHALSDVSTAALLAEATARSALVTVRVNVKLMRDETDRSRFSERIAVIDEAVTELRSTVFAAIDVR